MLLTIFFVALWAVELKFLVDRDPQIFAPAWEYLKRQGIDVHVEQADENSSGNQPDFVIVKNWTEYRKWHQAGRAYSWFEPQGWLPKAWQDPQGQIWPISWRARSLVVLISNAWVLKNFRHWDDWLNQVAMADLCIRERAHPYNQAWLGLWALNTPNLADQIWARMSPKLKILANDRAVLEAVRDGRCGWGIVNSYYVIQAHRTLGRPVWAFRVLPYSQGHWPLNGMFLIKTSHRSDITKQIQAIVAKAFWSQSVQLRIHEWVGEWSVQSQEFCPWIPENEVEPCQPVKVQEHFWRKFGLIYNDF